MSDSDPSIVSRRFFITPFSWDFDLPLIVVLVGRGVVVSTAGGAGALETGWQAEVQILFIFKLPRRVASVERSAKDA